jgi:carboxylesterase type B
LSILTHLSETNTSSYFYNAFFPNVELYPGAGVFHGSEVTAVFGTYPKEGATAEQDAVSAVMQRVWANFAKDPYSGPGWPQVPSVGVFENDGVHQESVYEVDGAGCDIFKGIYAMVT